MSLLDRPADHSADRPVLEAPLPRPRGPRTEHLLAHLRHRAHDLSPLPKAEDDVLSGDDTPLALHLLYELHYRGLAGVDERWEWHPALLAQRAVLEAELEDRLLAELGPTPVGLTKADVLAAV